VFGLGIKQGLYCVGCCWALMLVMFAVGVMNIVWMAGLGIVMTAEKIGGGRWLTSIVGATLIAGGIILAVGGLLGDWLARPF